MRRLLSVSALSLAFSLQPAAAVESECPVEIPGGTTTMHLTSYYGHEVGNTPYSDSTFIWVTGPGTVSASSEGHPIGHIWKADLYPIAECGTTPNSIFSDSFESGDFSAWQ